MIWKEKGAYEISLHTDLKKQIKRKRLVFAMPSRSRRVRCLRGRDGRLDFIEEDRAKIWKEHTEKIMNEENE